MYSKGGGRLAADVTDAEGDEEAAQRAALALLDAGKQVVQSLWADAVERQQFVAPPREVIEVRQAAYEAQAHQAGGELLSETLDVEASSACEMLEQTGHAGGAGAIRAVGGSLCGV